MSSEELTSKLKTLLGVGDDDKNLRYVVGAFLELVKLSNFDGKTAPKTKPKTTVTETVKEEHSESAKPIKQIVADNSKTKFGISYTINLNLPATTEIEVYNSIFKALRENLLDE